jgi:hypothetical protein
MIDLYSVCFANRSLASVPWLSTATPSRPGHPNSKAFWLKDVLSQQILDTRIITFSYNAVAVFGQSTAVAIDHAKSFTEQLSGQDRVERFRTWGSTG